MLGEHLYHDVTVADEEMLLNNADTQAINPSEKSGDFKGMWLNLIICNQLNPINENLFNWDQC